MARKIVTPASNQNITISTVRPHMSMVPTPTSMPGLKPGKTVGSKPGVTVEVSAPKMPKGPSHQEVVELLKVSGLEMTAKSSDHWHAPGLPKSPRLVLPKSDTVTRAFLYKAEAYTGLLGYKTPDQRKEEGLGGVTHVADVSTLEQFTALLTAVLEANGMKPMKAPKARTPSKRTRKAAPKATPSEQVAAPSDELVTSPEAS